MHMNITDSNGMIILKKKLQALKITIREWIKNAKKCSYKKKSSIQSKLSDIDKIIDQGGSNEAILNDRSILLKELQDIISMDSEEMAQKAKVRWAIEGDENSKYFHGILNNKRSQLAIRGGSFVKMADWILSLEQQVDLERTVPIGLNSTRSDVVVAVTVVLLCNTPKSGGSSGGSNEVILNDRSILLKELQDVISMDSEEVAQKAKVRWAIEGDENSKYFYGILNNKRSQLAIRGVLVNGDWIVEPKDVKNKFLNHFSSQFDRLVSHRICLADVFNNQLSLEQQVDLERTISKEEIKRAVWDCGTNKSHGPDGFTFEFFRRYWKIFEKDIDVAVTEFFSSGTFPKGCNSSFIALIPNTQNAKTVKDFRSISLIGSLYKIIAKILAN
ncbi:hypothetical protein Tco_0731770 [Tanacetum coccineum]